MERGNVMAMTDTQENVDMQPQSPFQKWLMDRGIRQSWLSDKTGLREPLISKIARKKTKPDIFQARRIVKALQEITSEVDYDILWPAEEEDTY